MKMNFLSELFANVGNVTWQHAVMWCIGGVLIYLAIAKKMEPALLLPIGFGTILVNLPLSGAVTLSASSPSVSSVKTGMDVSCACTRGTATHR